MLDQADMGFVAKLHEQWKVAPPLRVMVAAAVGYEAPEEKQYMTADAAREWMRLTGGRIDGVAPQGVPGRG